MCPGSYFALALSEEIPATMDDFHHKASHYIRCEEHFEMAKALKKGSSKMAQELKKDSSKRNESRGHNKDKEQYTLLNTILKKILEHTISTEMAAV